MKCPKHGPRVRVEHNHDEHCPLCVAYDEIVTQVARDAQGVTPIVWKDDGKGGFDYEEPTLLLTIARLDDVSDLLCRYRASVFQQAAAAVQDEPIFRVTTETREMAKHALQTWLDRHGPAWR